MLKLSFELLGRDGNKPGIPESGGKLKKTIVEPTTGALRAHNCRESLSTEQG